MVLRLTEGQYKRLLSEDNKSFLDGEVDFRNISNKVDRFVSNCFEYVFKLGKSIPDDHPPYTLYTKLFMDEFSLTESESVLLSHNYIKLNDKTGDFKKFIGKPLEYFGNFSWSGFFPVSAYISGEIAGEFTGYATTPEEFYSQLEDGEYENFIEKGGVEYHGYDLNWEYDNDYVGDSLETQLSGKDKEDVIDDITIGE